MKKMSIVLSLVALMLASSATAGVVSVNFEGNAYPGTFHLASTDVAGVVPAANWNNITSTITGALDDSGAGTTVDVTASLNSGWRTTGAPGANPDSQMLEGVLFGNEGGWTVSGTGISYASYDLYVYIPGDTAGRDYKVTVNGTTFYYDAMIPDGSGTYTLATTTTDPGAANAAAANYALFTGLTGDFTITMQGHAPGPDTSTNPQLSGLQIVEVPEPATMVLLGLGSLILRRRRS